MIVRYSKGEGSNYIRMDQIEELISMHTDVLVYFVEELVKWKLINEAVNIYYKHKLDGHVKEEIRTIIE